MNTLRLFLIIILTTTALVASDKKNGNDYVKVLIEGSHSELQAGTQLVLVFTFKMEKDWHIYWKNPGDAGLPTKIDLDLPEGIIADELHWPIPEKIKFDDFVNYGYSDSVKLIYPINIPINSKIGDYEIKANISWLVCKEECLPGKISKIVKFKIGSENILNDISGGISLKEYPSVLKENQGVSFMKNDTLIMQIGYKNINPVNIYAEYFPLDEGIYIYSGIRTSLEDNNIIEISLPLDPYRANNPLESYGLIIIRRYGDHKVLSSYYLKSKITN